MSVTVSILAPAEIVEELYAALVAQDVEIDEPRSSESMSDAADAAIGSKGVRAMLLLLTLAFNTASAGVALADKLIDLKHKLTGAEAIELIHPKTGKSFMRIDQNTGDQVIRDLLSRGVEQ